MVNGLPSSTSMIKKGKRWYACFSRIDYTDRLVRRLADWDNNYLLVVILLIASSRENNNSQLWKARPAATIVTNGLTVSLTVESLLSQGNVALQKTKTLRNK